MMRKKSALKTASNGSPGTPEFRTIPLVEIVPSPHNTRKQFDDCYRTVKTAEK
jgi:hypothetical protein